MPRLIAAIAVAAALAGTVAACGGGSDEPAISSGAAKSAVERAAGVRLVATPVPGEARKEGLEESFSNAGTAVKDHQVVFLFVMKNADVADKVRGSVKGMVPGASRIITRDRVLVLYGTDGNDHGKQLQQAVETL